MFADPLRYKPITKQMRLGDSIKIKNMITAGESVEAVMKRFSAIYSEDTLLKFIPQEKPEATLPEATIEVKPKRRRRTKAEMAAAREAETNVESGNNM